MKGKSWSQSMWTISLGTALFTFILTAIYDYLKNKPFLTTIISVFNYIVNFIVTFLNFQIKIWMLILGIIIILVVIVLIIRKEEIKPDFANYVEDRFFRWKWTWKWILTGRGWEISELTAHCPKCDTMLIQHSTYYSAITFECPRCNTFIQESQIEEPYKIRSLIIDNIERKRKTGQVDK